VANVPAPFPGIFEAASPALYFTCGATLKSVPLAGGTAATLNDDTLASG
jgi:hypothetical protein